MANTNNILFSEKSLNRKYRIKGKDRNIHVPGYSGKLSGIRDAAIVQAMIDRGSNLVETITVPEKETPPAKP